MRPVKLLLEGFTSFRRAAEIDFTDLTLFGISGATGSGKTSILDAMLYALYAQTPRLGKQGLDALISQGARELRVLLEFTVGGKRYRIGRHMKRKGAATVRLEVEQDGRWTSLADGAKEAHEKVAALIGLDYQGFTRSVILPQGEFDQFLRGDSATRSKILTALLDLGLYDRMQELARGRWRTCEAGAKFEAEDLENNYAAVTAAALAAERDRLAAIEAERERAEAACARLQTARAAAYAVRDARQQAVKARTAAEDAIRLRLQAREAAGIAEEAAAREQKRLAGIAAQLRECGYDARRHNELSQAWAAADLLEQCRRDIAADMETVASLRGQLPALEEAREKAEAAHRAADGRLREAGRARDNMVERYGSIAGLEQLHREAEALPRREAEHDSALSALEELARREDELGADIAALTAQLETATAKARQAEDDLLRLHVFHAAADLKRHLKPGEPCPVCEQVVAVPPPGAPVRPLDEARKAAAAAVRERDSIQKDLAARQAELGTLPALRAQRAKAAADLYALIAALRERIAALPAPVEEMIAGFRQAEQAVPAAQQAVFQAGQEAGRAALAVESHRNALAAAERSLTQREKQASQFRGRLDEFPELAALDPRELRTRWQSQDEAGRTHEALSREQSRQQEAVTAANRLAWEAAARARHAEESREAAGRALAEADAALRQAEEALAPMLAGLELPAGAGEAAELDALLARRQAEIARLAGEAGRARETAAHLERRLGEKTAKERRRAELESHAALWQDLTRHLRADHMKAHIQDEALAKLAENGTRRLRELSDSRYSFTLAGGEFAVIDHWNANEPRTVKTLSGGESFLASLALALALSESLSEYCADRDRLALDSLFLDEGFSTLDGESLDVVVDALEALAGDRRLIGVISHVGELAARLPARLEVEKTPGGSAILPAEERHRHAP